MGIFKKNTGEKVMLIAEIIGDICIAAAVLLLLYFFIVPKLDYILCIFILIIAFISAVPLYAFGKLVKAAGNIEHHF